MNESVLVKGSASNVITTQVTQEVLANYKFNNQVNDYALVYGEDAEQGTRYSMAYVNISEGPPGSNSVFLQYWLYFPNHGNWENVTVRLNSAKTQVQKIYLSRYGELGRWYDPDEISYEPFYGQPIVYVALDSHAFYPKAGSYHLPSYADYLGWLNDIRDSRIYDYTSDGGFEWGSRWDTQHQIISTLTSSNSSEPPWTLFGGKWKFKDGDAGPKYDRSQTSWVLMDTGITFYDETWGNGDVVLSRHDRSSKDLLAYNLAGYIGVNNKIKSLRIYLGYAGTILRLYDYSTPSINSSYTEIKFMKNFVSPDGYLIGLLNQSSINEQVEVRYVNKSGGVSGRISYLEIEPGDGVEIQGPYLLCDYETYRVSTVVPYIWTGQTHWDVSSNSMFSVAEEYGGDSFTTGPSNTANGEAFIYAMPYSPAGLVQGEKRVWVGKPVTPSGSLTGPTSVSKGSYVTYNISSSTADKGTYQWKLPGQGKIFSNVAGGDNWAIVSGGNGYPYAQVYVGKTSGYVEVRKSNECGTGGAKIKWASVSVSTGSSSSSGGPVSGPAPAQP